VFKPERTGVFILPAAVVDQEYANDMPFPGKLETPTILTAAGGGFTLLACKSGSLPSESAVV